MKNSIKKQLENGDYANAKNIASVFIGEGAFRPDDWGMWYLALSASALGDYYLADEIFRYWLHAKPDWALTRIEMESNEQRRKMCKTPEIDFFYGLKKHTFKKRAYLPVTYDEAFERNAFEILSLRGTSCYYAISKVEAFFELVKRLSYSFNKIRKPISLYLFKGKRNFDEIFEKTIKIFDKNATWTWAKNPYSAACFYNDPSRYILFVDYNNVNYNIVKCVGMIIHELTHLEQRDVGICDAFHSFPLFRSGFIKKENVILGERLTDLQVIGKGFGYELSCDRRGLGINNPTNFDQFDILKIIDGSANY